MESYAFQDLPPKKIKKYASRFTDDEIRASLGEDADNLPFLVEEHGFLTIMFWNAYCGPMICMDDDSVRAYAQVEYLRRNGYPCLKSVEEIEPYASMHNWPRKSRDSLP
jgi:hypothetical protein